MQRTNPKCTGLGEGVDRVLTLSESYDGPGWSGHTGSDHGTPHLSSHLPSPPDVCSVLMNWTVFPNDSKQPWRLPPGREESPSLGSSFLLLSCL